MQWLCRVYSFQPCHFSWMKMHKENINWNCTFTSMKPWYTWFILDQRVFGYESQLFRNILWIIKCGRKYTKIRIVYEFDLWTICSVTINSQFCIFCATNTFGCFLINHWCMTMCKQVLFLFMYSNAGRICHNFTKRNIMCFLGKRLSTLDMR